MSYDFFAQYPIANQRDAKNLPFNLAPYTRTMLYAQALISPDKEKVRNHEYKNELSKWGKSSSFSLLKSLQLDTPRTVDLHLLPFGSFVISFKFQLTRPYISGGDEPFYIIDNPIAKEKVFKLPMVRSSGWKGSLRASIRLAKGWGENNGHPTLLRLFGSVNDNDTGERGQLRFYPTFFDSIAREVINPHGRKEKAGKLPIYFECVPIDTIGIFTLLYVPSHRVNKSEGDILNQAEADLSLVMNVGIKQMMETYGFGAKTSSGYGTARILRKTLNVQFRQRNRVVSLVTPQKEGTA